MKKFATAALILLIAGTLLTFISAPKLAGVKSAYSLEGPNGQPIETNGPRIPSGWTLEPAGNQITTLGQPDGVTLSPDNKTLMVPTSGQWHESLSLIDTSSLANTQEPAASAFEGVAEDAYGNIWLSGGGKNMIYHYQSNGPDSATPPPNSTSLIPPLASPPGISAPGYPANMVLGSNGWLYAAGSLPMPQSTINSLDPTAGNCPSGSDLLGGGSSTAVNSCSVVDAFNISATGPLGSNPTLNYKANLIPVGQDAYSIAINNSTDTLYVSNWADSSSSRAGGVGTVSVISLSSSGTGSEVQSVPVGIQPMGIALNPQENMLAVANARSNSISLITLNTSGKATSVRSVPVGLSPSGPRGSQPVAVSFSPDGRYIFVSLFGLNAIEVLNSDGSPISQTVLLSTNNGSYSPITIPITLIPTGWMPIASSVGAEPSGSSLDFRLYVANYQGMGTGPGLYDPASDSIGNSQYTEGSVSVIDVPYLISDAQFATWTAQSVAADNLLPLLDTNIVSPETNPCDGVQLPDGTIAYSQLLCDAHLGKIPVKDLHVMVVLRENKTVDSMLGYLSSSLTSLNADVNYETYGQSDTPNLAKIASTYGINDNNWVAGDESETGHSTLTGGETTPYTELFVHVNNDFGLRGNRNGDPINDNPTTRLADEAKNAGLSEVTYGGDLNPNSPANANEIPEAIWGNASSAVFSGTNTDYPDTDRISLLTTGSAIDEGWDQYHNPTPPAMFEKPIGLCGGPVNFCNYPGASTTDYSKYSLAGWENTYNTCIANGGTNLSCQSAMPNLSIVELPDDHTDVFNSGNNPLMWAPQVMVANNDYATGQLVQALSNSPFWSTTLVMIVEDDTQFTADHINTLRSYIVTAGGLAKLLGPTNQVSHQVSSFCAIDKTIEDLYSLESMSICDASSSPLDSLLSDSFTSSPPKYVAVMPQTPYMFSFPQAGSTRFEPWCAGDSPTGIGFNGLLHYQTQECFASYVGYLAKSLNIG
jgi:DNA-binding beta-propeller fold protein YncE